MKKKEINEFLNKANIETHNFIPLKNVDFIELKNHTKIYPNIKNMRFCFDDKFLYVLNGTSKAFGQSFGTLMRFSADFTSVAFPPEDIVTKTGFRLPKPGDIIRACTKTSILSEVFIDAVYNAFNEFVITFVRPIRISGRAFQLNYYDPKEFNSNTSFYLFEDGLYLNFIPDKTDKKCKDGDYSYKISIKKIASIRLKEV